jgi:hypothetical protein
MCLGKKKQLAVINLTDEKLVVEKTRDLPEPIVKVDMDGQFVCVALTSQYLIFNFKTGHSQDLFPIEGVPVIARVAKVCTSGAELGA